MTLYIDPYWSGGDRQLDLFYSFRVEALIRRYRRAVPQGISEDEIEHRREEFIKQHKGWLKSNPGVCFRISPYISCTQSRPPFNSTQQVFTHGCNPDPPRSVDRQLRRGTGVRLSTFIHVFRDCLDIDELGQAWQEVGRVGSRREGLPKAT